MLKAFPFITSAIDPFSKIEGVMEFLKMLFFNVAFLVFRFLLFVLKKNSDGWCVRIFILTTFYIPNEEDQKPYSDGKTYANENDNNVHG